MNAMRDSYSDLLSYYGEKPSTPSEEFFGALVDFLAMFEKAHKVGSERGWLP